MKKVLTVVLMLAICFSLTVPVFASDFHDVPEAVWYEYDLDYAVRIGMVKGDGAGHFLPEQSVAMAQFVTMLGRVFSPIVSNSYDRYIEWALNSGYFDDFDPDATILVDHFAVLLDMFMYRYGLDMPEVDPEYMCIDFNDVAGYAQQSTDRMLRYGLLVVGEDNHLYPYKKLTRAECMASIVRLAKAQGIR